MLAASYGGKHSHLESPCIIAVDTRLALLTTWPTVCVCTSCLSILSIVLATQMLQGPMLHGQMLHGQMLHGQMWHGQMLHGQMVLGHLSTVKDGSTSLKLEKS